ncbi:hypothetical protein KBP30_38380 [Streptomyces sp. Go40/10]|uniref:hypothetical protein n=1 Tax=Streptomyces sp. Go40/10 TaxID=2825844 RepID=UPI001E3C60F0|nr:hypothetical protein [Streptomyces sp. Go40/10]UFR06688.1 hypothetical protein KBP30_38380 [Streptomyces sp. Go40/10]
MTGRTDKPADPYARARGDEEPGAYSGGESQARERSVPGTASAREGYQPEDGTGAGEPLRGVDAREREEEDREGKDRTDSGR